MSIIHYICKTHQYLFKMNQKINRLKIVLVEQGKSGKWLAEKLGKDQSTISKWCSNKTQPTLENIAKIAEVLEINMRELINDNYGTK